MENVPLPAAGCPEDPKPEAVGPHIFGTVTPSYQAFLNDLPELLEKYPEQFAAYNDSGRIDIDFHSFALRARLEKLGVLHEIYFIEPQGMPVSEPSS